MITKLLLKIGSSIDSPPITIPIPPSVTIFIGPNNSGKSLVLREIRNFCRNGQSGPHNHILDALEFAPVDESTAQAELKSMSRLPSSGEVIPEQHIAIKQTRTNQTVIYTPNYVASRLNPNGEHRGTFTNYFLGDRTLDLDGKRRISLLDPTPRGDLGDPRTPLASILMNDPGRQSWQDKIYDALGIYPGINALIGDQLSVRFGETRPAGERALEQPIVEWMQHAALLENVSDGVKSYAGILLELDAGSPEVIIVDEPEAFLHPSLAGRLGRELANAAVEKKKHVFAATHSAHFLMGAIESGATINIVRLTRRGKIATARVLDSATLLAMKNDPLLRSVGVLDGLFFEHVIVTEADADRAFYAEINHRLGAMDDPRHIPHSLFLNARGKDTVQRIIDPLRRIGIPSVAVVDLDLVKSKGEVFTRHLQAARCPALLHQAFHDTKTKILNALEATTPDGEDKKKYFKIAGGVDLLKGDDKVAANQFFDQLAICGYFVVRQGEVEHWLRPQLPNIIRNKDKTGDESWQANIFEAMGSDPKSDTYITPTPGDVWEFIGELRKWLQNPERRGIPD